MAITDLLKILKEVGLQKVAYGVSFLAWFILPFWLWQVLPVPLGEGLPFSVFLVIGIIIIANLFALLTRQAHAMMTREFRTMKLIGENATELFDNPRDTEKIQEFNHKWQSLSLVSRLRLPISIAGMRGMASGLKNFLAFLMGSTLGSYVVLAFYFTFKNQLIGFFTTILTPITPTMPEQISAYVDAPIQFIGWASENVWFSILIIWFLSLYYDPYAQMLRESRELHIPKSQVVPYLFVSTFSILMRIGNLILYPVYVPSFFKRRKLVTRCEPFIDPNTLPTIVSKAVRNVEGKDCHISRSREIEEESDIVNAKTAIMKDPKIPGLIKYFLKSAQTEDLMRRVRETQPMAFVGVQDKRCVFFGIVRYDPVMRVRTADFYFDTSYLKREFLLIYEEEAKKQRQISRKLPEFSELLRRLGEAND